MTFDLQPANLINEWVQMFPLKEADFDILYEAAADPLLWEQHPNPDRYKREVFENYFQGAMESGGAFLICDAATLEVIGSSRFYEYDAEASSIAIGYTFFRRDHWGGTYNPAVKNLMINHAFQYVDNIIFHIGAANKRSQIAIERIGAKKIDAVEMNYYGESQQLNFVYRIRKEDWSGQTPL